VSVLRELTFSSARMGLYEPIRNYLVGTGHTGGLPAAASAAELFS